MKEEMIAYLAEWFGVEPDDDGNFNLNSYYWQAGCSFSASNGKWLCLAEIVDCMENFMDDYGIDDD